MGLTLLFAIVIGVIRAQPYDDSAIRNFLTPPESCDGPCLMGIQTGVTTRDQALAILQANPWVGTITQNSVGISWVWNGKQPAFLGDSTTGVYSGNIDFINGIVRDIDLVTPLAWGDFLFVLGAPTKEGFVKAGYSPRGSVPKILHYAVYYKQKFTIETFTSCPINQGSDLWYSTGVIAWPGGIFSSGFVGLC